MVPVEAQAFGRPVIAFGAGGATETVIASHQGVQVPADMATGVFCHEQTVASLVEAIRTFEAMESDFSPQSIRQHAEQFDKSHFLKRMDKFVKDRLGGSGEPSSSISDRPTLFPARIGA